MNFSVLVKISKSFYDIGSPDCPDLPFHISQCFTGTVCLIRKWENGTCNLCQPVAWYWKGLYPEDKLFVLLFNSKIRFPFFGVPRECHIAEASPGWFLYDWIDPYAKNHLDREWLYRWQKSLLQNRISDLHRPLLKLPLRQMGKNVDREDVIVKKEAKVEALQTSFCGQGNGGYFLF